MASQEPSKTDPFRCAADLCHSIVKPSPSDAMDQVSSENEQYIFRPSLELQIAGLNMLQDKSFEDSAAHAVSFACFGVDHVIWCWNLAVAGQVRVAFTLARSAVEAFIFEMAAVLVSSAFEEKWNTRKGTAGFFLNHLEGVSPRVRGLAQAAWSHCAQLGHPSIWPVMGAVERIESEQGVFSGMTFAGQHAGCLNANTFQHLVSLNSMAALLGVEAMNLALASQWLSDRWKETYSNFQERLGQHMQIPTHLKDISDGERNCSKEGSV